MVLPRQLIATMERQLGLISGWSACALYGLEGFDLRSTPWIVVPPQRQVRGVDFIVQRAELDRVDLATVGRLPA